jgi:hypothetical protein
MKLSKIHKHSYLLRLSFATAALRPTRMKISTIQLTLVTLLVALSTASGNCGSAKVAGQREISTTPTNRPTVIYVADFELDAADIKSKKGLLPALPKLPGPLGEIAPPPPGAPQDPQKLARKLMDEMSEALVKDLTKAGFTARRLISANSLPTSGWLVRGVFTEVNQGNQLHRAVIGFGVGKTDLQVLVDIADLAHGTPKNFYELNTTATSGKASGAGPMIALCPAGAVARFVIAGKDLDKNVKQTATQIASEVVERTKPDKSTLTAETQRRRGES